MPQRLGKEDPEGRMDVLAFKLLEGVIKGIERAYGIEGLWDELSSGVESGIREKIPNTKVPTERDKVIRFLANTLKG